MYAQVVLVFSVELVVGSKLILVKLSYRCSMSLGVGRGGGSSFGSSSFLDGSMYCHTSLVVAVSWMIKNHCVQSEGWLRIRLTFE